MSGRLGQWDFDYAVPEVDYGFDYALPDFDYGYVDPGAFDYADYGYWDDYTVPEISTGDLTMLGQDYEYAGLEPISDASGNVYYYDPAGYVTYAEDATGTPIPTEQQASELQATYVTPEAAATDFGNMFPDVDWNALLKAGVDIYKTYTQMEMAERAGAAPRPTATPTTRTNPTTGQREYYNPATRTWQAAPPTPGTVPTATAQIVPGIPNTTLLIGAGVIALAFMLRR